MGPLTTQLPNGQSRTALANEMNSNLSNSSQYREVTPQEAQRLANEGKVVIAVQPAKDHGHIATVRPDNLFYETPPSRGSGPVINNVGRNVGIVRASATKAADRAFRPEPLPKYYTTK